MKVEILWSGVCIVDVEDAEPDTWVDVLERSVEAKITLPDDQTVITFKLNVDEYSTVCRVCGCTNSVACEGGCHWIEEDLCSSCEGKEPIDVGSPAEGT